MVQPYGHSASIFLFTCRPGHYNVFQNLLFWVSAISEAHALHRVAWGQNELFSAVRSQSDSEPRDKARAAAVDLFWRGRPALQSPLMCDCWPQIFGLHQTLALHRILLRHVLS